MTSFNSPHFLDGIRGPASDSLAVQGIHRLNNIPVEDFLEGNDVDHVALQVKHRIKKLSDSLLFGQMGCGTYPKENRKIEQPCPFYSM